MKKRVVVITILVITLISLAVTVSGACGHNYQVDHTWVVGYINGGDVCERWIGIALKCTLCGYIHTTQGMEEIPHNDAFLRSYLTGDTYMTENYCGKYMIREYECSNCGRERTESELHSTQPHNVQTWYTGGYYPEEGGYLHYGDCILCGATITYFGN